MATRMETAVFSHLHTRAMCIILARQLALQSIGVPLRVITTRTRNGVFADRTVEILTQEIPRINCFDV